MFKHTLRKAAGHTHSIGLDGKVYETDTHQCCHCDKHFDFIKGETYAFCQYCMKVTCSSKECREHFPFEERMELFEKGLLPKLNSSRDEIQRRKIIV